eukprot:10994082-Prorocentrum_lima.AAC.1
MDDAEEGLATSTSGMAHSGGDADGYMLAEESTVAAAVRGADDREEVMAAAGEAAAVADGYGQD